MKLSPNISDNSSPKLPVLFRRDGVYYARFRTRKTGELLEVALHGISSEEQARAAAQVLDGSTREKLTTE